MNKEIVLLNLQEAEKELQNTINAVRKDSDYDEGEFYVSMQHIYAHLNTAWNAKEVVSEQYAHQNSDDFLKWRQFPGDMDMIGRNTKV